MQLYAALKESQHPPETNELRPYLDRLIKDGRYTEAYQSWRGTLAAEQRTKQILLYNGDFALPNRRAAIQLASAAYPGREHSIVASPGKDKGRALQLEFSGTRASFVVGQLDAVAARRLSLQRKRAGAGLAHGARSSVADFVCGCSQ